MTTTTTTFKANQSVKVISSAHAPKEKCGIARKVGTFVEYTTNGFARIRIREQLWLVHPENLAAVDTPPDYPITCVVPDCGFYANDLSDYCAMHG